MHLNRGVILFGGGGGLGSFFTTSLLKMGWRVCVADISIKNLDNLKESLAEDIKLRVDGYFECDVTMLNDIERVFSQASALYDEIDVIFCAALTSEALVNVSPEDILSETLWRRTLDVKLSGAGFEMMRGQTCDHGMPIKHFQKFDMVLSGHFHHKSTQGNITYLGNPYEITWGDYDDPRGFHIFDTDTRELEFIQNPIRMFHKVWYNDDQYDLDQMMNLDFDHFKGKYIKVIVQTKKNPYWFDQFLDKLYKCDPTHLTIVEDNKNLDLEKDEEIMDAEDTLTILNKYVDGIESDVDKKKLSGLLNDLYTEALYIE